MRAKPLELAEANEFVKEHHRHHIPVHRDKFRLGCIDDNGKLVGVIQCARPVSRMLDNGENIEVVRCCTDGTPNACSFLYSRMARICKEMGYKKIITYILQSEDGASLKACGWTCECDDCGGGTWDCPSRRRSGKEGERPKYPTEKKKRYIKFLQKEDKE